MDLEEENVFEIQFPVEKKKVYKFRYGTEAQVEQSISQFDFEPVEFDRKELGDKSEEIKTKEYCEENTLLMIKPSAMIYKDHIKTRLFQEGYITLKERTVWLKPEDMSEFYIEHYGKPWFPKFLMKMSAGPVTVMVLAKLNAVQDLKTLMGNRRVSIARRESPYSLRALYGLKGDSATNAVHGSDTVDKAAKEIQFFFKQALPEPPPKISTSLDYIQENMHDIVLQALLEMDKEKPDNPTQFLAKWFLSNNIKAPLIQPEYLMSIRI